MSRARFRFDAELASFLAPALRAGEFEHECARAATLKNAIEALGVPHTEVGEIRANGAPATLQRIVREGDRVEVFPASVEEVQQDVLFLADAHLGALARFLRMLGFDTLYDNAYSDAAIRRIAEAEGRVVLTRDRELLKCREIARGRFVRALKPEAQLVEVAAHFGLARAARPFSLCLRCNLPLEAVEKEAVRDAVPERVLAVQERFTRCPGCGGIFWPGSHYARMQAALGPALSS